jgi:hypothetical protein
MSIDNFWSVPSGSAIPEFNPPLVLESSSYVKNASAFKGTKYSIFLETQFSLTLFKKKILPEEIKNISLQLNDFIKSHQKNTKKWSPLLTNKEILDLHRMFSTYAELNASLAGWW